MAHDFRSFHKIRSDRPRSGTGFRAGRRNEIHARHQAISDDWSNLNPDCQKGLRQAIPGPVNANDINGWLQALGRAGGATGTLAAAAGAHGIDWAMLAAHGDVGLTKRAEVRIWLCPAFLNRYPSFMLRVLPLTVTSIPFRSIWKPAFIEILLPALQSVLEPLLNLSLSLAEMLMFLASISSVWCT